MRSIVLAALAFVLAGCATATDLGEPFDSGHGDAAHVDQGAGDTATTNDSGTNVDTGGGGDTASSPDTGGIDTSVDTSIDSGVDSGIDTRVDTGVDSGIDTAPDVIVADVSTDGGVTTVTFPDTTSTTYDSVDGVKSTLGSGGGGVFYVSGTYCEQTFPRATSVSELDLDFRMADLTTGCSTGATLSWNVEVNGTVVGTYSFVSASDFGDRTIVESYTFAPIAPVSGGFTLRLEATSTVCSGGSSWNWYPGGTATMK